MKILCIGDSNTYGHDPRSYVGSRYPEDIRWTGRLRKSLPEGWTLINAGMNGMTAARARLSFGGRIRKEDPNLVIVMLGTNDVLVGYDIEETADCMDDLITSILEDGRQVLLVAPPLLRPGEWVQGEGQIEEIRSLSELYRETAGWNHCQFADACEWDIDLTFDGVHFSPEGHEMFADRLRDVLARSYFPASM